MIDRRILQVVLVGVVLMSGRIASAAYVVNYELYVSSYLGNQVLRWNSVTNSVATLNNGSGGLTGPESVAVGSDDLIYVAAYNGTGGNKIYRYSPTTGAFANIFASTNLSGPIGFDFDANGKSYAVNGIGGNVARFQSNGTFDGTFATVSGGYRGHWGPDGNYYLAIYGTGQIRKYNSAGVEQLTSGNPWVNGTLGGAGLVDLDWGPDGNMYVANYNQGSVYRVNPVTGALVNTVITGLGAFNPYGMVFTLDDKLWITSYTASTVKGFNYSAGTNWTLNSTVMTSANGLSGAAGIDVRYLPEPTSLSLLLVGVATLARRPVRRLA